MPIALTVQHIQKSFGVHVVLSDVSFQLSDRGRMGLIGRNGCGKSTLLDVLHGQTQDAGSVTMAKDWRSGLLRQHNTFDAGHTVWQVLEHVFMPLFEIENSLRDLEVQMAAAQGDMFDRLAKQYDALQHTFEQQKGYRWRSEVQGVLIGLGFGQDTWDQPAHTLSGGESTRLAMARLLLLQPDLLLLDEPTNHLDLRSVAWLETVLQNYAGALVMVSHDRYFLDRVCNCMGELQDGRIEMYDGNYSQFIRKRDARLEADMKAFDLQQDEIKRQQKIIARYRMFNREKSIKAAESREKMLERMVVLDKPQVDDSTMALRFAPRRRSGEEVLNADQLGLAYGDKTLFSNIDMRIRSGDRIALIGANGIGKTSLIRMLVPDSGKTNEENGMQPHTQGSVRYGSNVDIGYYDQHHANLSQNKTVLDEVWDAFPRLTQSEVRGALGAFLFIGDDVFQPIATLSGGERARVALTKLMLQGDNLLIMDEPTNHLDILSKERLEEALDQYKGTLLCISHDRYFINRVAHKVWEMDTQGITEYLGNYDDYLAKREQLAWEMQADEDRAPVTRTALREERKRERMEREERKQRQQELRALEQHITDLEQELADLEAQLCQPELFQDVERARQVTARHHQVGQEVEQAYEELMAGMQQRQDV